MGRLSFTPSEIDELRRLLREKQTADRSRQRTLRARMRRLGFYISDFSSDPAGFVVSDLDDLVSRGVITVVDDGGSTTAMAAPEHDFRSTSKEPGDAGNRPRSADDSEFEVCVSDVMTAFEYAKAQAPVGSQTAVPSRPGLYSIHAEGPVWHELGIGDPPDSRPLYLGKAEDSLLTRDVMTHFGDGRTGQSTVRRSLAALLHDTHGFRGIPRNPRNPGYFSCFGLCEAQESELGAWMHERLKLAIWPKPSGCPYALKSIETAILVRLGPPLNLQDVVTPWTTQVRAARAVMAAEARAWAESHR
jgi:hypothetical protein